MFDNEIKTIFFINPIIFILQSSILLNLYNGDILNISSNFEYMIWHIILLLPYLYLKNKEYILEIICHLLSIIFNIYWHYAWIKDLKEDGRHRTELYDTQTLICCFFFILSVRRYDIHNTSVTNI